MKHSNLLKKTALVRSLLLLCAAIVVNFTFTACDDDDEPDTPEKSITVIMSKLGKGNKDYCSLIYQSIDRWQKSGKVKMTVHYPKTNEEATSIYHSWARQTAGQGQSLMVVANGEYTQMVMTEQLTLNDNQQVLAFEMPELKPMKGVHTFQLSHTGLAYLSGKIAGLSQEALLLVGHKTPTLVNACASFRKGYGNQGSLTEIELSNTFTGFNMPHEAKEIARQHKDAFILPLAGLSNNGVYEFLHECKAEDKIIAAGVDIDCNSFSVRVPFSYMINIDKAIDLHLQCWLDGKPWPAPDLGLKDGMTEVRINPDFTEVGGITKADLERVYKEYFQEAQAMD